MAAVQTKDEFIASVDAALEVAIASLLAGNNAINRVDALREIVRRSVKKNVRSRYRVRTSQTT